MLKRILLALLAILIIAVPIAAQGDSPDDCDLELLTDWLIVRQVGWLHVVAALEESGLQLNSSNIGVIVDERHILEDTPRPVCADAAYIASIGRYDNYVDGFLLSVGAIELNADDHRTRYDQFNDLVQSTVLELDALVDVDIMAAAQEIIDTEATPTPDD